MILMLLMRGYSLKHVYSISKFTIYKTGIFCILLFIYIARVIFLRQYLYGNFGVASTLEMQSVHPSEDMSLFSPTFRPNLQITMENKLALISVATWKEKKNTFMNGNLLVIEFWNQNSGQFMKTTTVQVYVTINNMGATKGIFYETRNTTTDPL